MTSELRSTARPSALRLAGFLAIVTGAVLVGIGATREWVTVGLVSDIEGAIDVPVHGTDEWEGKAVLLGAAVALVLMLVIRLARSTATRRVLAYALIVIGVLSSGLSGSFAVQAEDRYAGTEGIRVLAEEIARENGDAVDVVEAALLEALQGELRVEIGLAVWLVLVGGAILAAGGALTLVWIRERERTAVDEGRAAGVV